MMTPIKLDLRRDLPKVREHFAEVVAKAGSCSYAAPCAIGAMVAPEFRRGLDEHKSPEGVQNQRISELVRQGVVAMPSEQIGDALRLQRAADSWTGSRLAEVLAELEAKYLGEQSA